jgi:hypothetical protein
VATVGVVSQVTPPFTCTGTMWLEVTDYNNAVQDVMDGYLIFQ